MTPQISIIIPTFNRVHLLGETLDSIIAQTYKNWECIVVDDGSTDYTTQLLEFYLEKDSRFSFCNRPENKPKGANACRNYGFELSQGQYINWFDSDDIMPPEKLEIQLAALEKTSWSFCVCQTLVFEISIKNILGYRNEKIISDNFFYDYLTMKIGWLTQAPLWRREFLDRMDYLFDEELQAAQEWEFHLRSLDKVSNYLIVEKPLVFIRKHEAGITYNNSEDIRIYNYFLGRLKIHQNEKLNLTEEDIDFLSGYLLNAFKRMVVTRNNYAKKAYRRFVLKENRFSKAVKSNALIAMYSYRIFNRGNVFLQKIKYSK